MRNGSGVDLDAATTGAGVTVGVGMTAGVVDTTDGIGTTDDGVGGADRGAGAGGAAAAGTGPGAEPATSVSSNRAYSSSLSCDTECPPAFSPSSNA